MTSDAGTLDPGAPGLRDRYASWSTGVGADIEAGKHDFKSHEQHLLDIGDITPNKSGRQEAWSIGF